MHQENLSLNDFLNHLEKAPSPEEKVTLSLAFMKACLFRDKQPFFRGFWQGREKAFENLKNLASSPLWVDYKSLCEEFQKVKSIIDDQAAFAAEQIEIALVALKPEAEKVLQEKDWPSSTQLIERLSSLRQEVQKSGMKARLKGSLLETINGLIESLLPLKREFKARLIEQAALFKEKNFEDKAGQLAVRPGLKMIDLQDQVKEMQAAAKALQVRSIRDLLGSCWAALQQAREEYKLQKTEERQAIQKKLDELKEAVETGLLIDEKRQETIATIKARTGRKESSSFLQEMDKILEPIRKAEEEKRQSTLTLQQQALTKREGKLKALEEALEAKNLAEAETLFKDVTLSLSEKLALEPLYLGLVDETARLKNQREMAQSSGDRLVLEQILKRTEEAYTEAKERLDLLKKQSASSNSDFQLAWLYNQALQQHKERVETLAAELVDLEDKIEQTVTHL